MATITCITTLLLVGTSKLDLHTNWFLSACSACLDQPIPNKFANVPSHTPRLELTGKPHDAAKRQDVLGNAGEVLFFGYWHDIEIDVLDVIRLINQIDRIISRPRGYMGRTIIHYTRSGRRLLSL